MTAPAPDASGRRRLRLRLGLGLGLGVVVPLLLLTACAPRRPPPPGLVFEGLPVSGDLAVARRAGFTWCIRFSDSVRCRRQGVTLGGEGPYSAAVDLRGGDGGGGFDQLILWHDMDQHAVYALGEMLERRGWRLCYTTTGRGAWGDQKVFTRPGSRVRFAMDLSYWIKRRFRVIPERNRRKPSC